MDAHLTPYGWAQARKLNSHIKQLGSRFRADAIIVSPLMRTLETAAGVFGSGLWQEDDLPPPLMLRQVCRGCNAEVFCNAHHSKRAPVDA